MTVLKWLLFETRIGSRLLALFEQVTGLALVDADWLGSQSSDMPQAAGGE
jgi:hypothetical protein